MLVLSLGWGVPEANAGLKGQWRAEKQQALKELRARQFEQRQAYKASLQAQGLTKKEYKALMNEYRNQQRDERLALKAVWKEAWRAGTWTPGGGIPGGGGSIPGGTGGTTTGGGGPVPIPGTLLPFAGAFAGLAYWRPRQLRA